MINKAITLIKVSLNSNIDLDSQSYNCEECRRRGYYKDRNCSGGDTPTICIRDENVRYVVDKATVLNYCPKILLYDDDVLELLQLYTFWKNGMMPEAGGIYNQPYFYVKAMTMIHDEIMRIEAEQLKQQ